MRRFEGRVAVITAGGSGMARAIALRLAGEGAVVHVVDIDGAAAQATVDDIVAAGGSASGHACDVVDTSQLQALYDDVGGQHEAIHVLHNQVGVPGDPGVDVTEEEWHRVLDLNLKSAWFGASLALPLMRRAGGKGSITFTSSISGVVGSPFSPLYSLTKTGLLGLVRSLAMALGPDGIRVNAICPGPTDTPMFPDFFRTDDPDLLEERRKGIMARVPLGRMGTPEDVAGAISFLASDDAAFVTGVALPVDGGMLAG